METVKLALALKVLSFNIAGIPYVHPGLDERVEKIGPQLGAYDVVAVQEAWLDKDARRLSELSGLPESARYQRELAIGTGLAILSRWPIVEKKQLSFTCRPSAARFYQGEWPANKGALMARIQTPKGRLDVYNTHLIAGYADSPYRTLRLAQVFELAEFIRENSRDTPFILLGDLNSGPRDRAYGILKDLLGLQDVCERTACRIDHVMLPKGRVRARAYETLSGLSDHDAMAAELDWSALRLRLRPDRRDRLGALEDVETAMQGLIELLARRRRARSWIPGYGFLMGLRYDRQTRLVAWVRDRAASARLAGGAL